MKSSLQKYVWFTQLKTWHFIVAFGQLGLFKTDAIWKMDFWSMLTQIVSDLTPSMKLHTMENLLLATPFRKCVVLNLTGWVSSVANLRSTRIGNKWWPQSYCQTTWKHYHKLNGKWAFIVPAFECFSVPRMVDEKCCDHIEHLTLFQNTKTPIVEDLAAGSPGLTWSCSRTLWLVDKIFPLGPGERKGTEKPPWDKGRRLRWERLHVNRNIECSLVRLWHQKETVQKKRLQSRNTSFLEES